ncbi:MAG TPA: metallophosphoesterase family protein [Pedobacter sp.]|nr:metallophosphoesterase family protein [Pedobacter sp.]
MVTIGLLSDTHGFLDDAVFRHFADCDEIWHAGDFGADVAEPVAAFKPLRGVYGNIDGKEIRSVYPEHNRFSIEGLDVWMTHIGGYPGKYSPFVKPDIYTKPPKLFICGHSHILKVLYDKKNECLHINPGAAGNSGWHRVKTLIKFNVTDGKIHNLAAIEIGNR